ncbi:MAG: histidine phosphatase family protein [Ruminococcaceae bacterium]|nr:histidine phosphatase family protein [Oscillospiraceae bacterium]
MKTYKIHLIRHGLTEGNLEGKYIGHKDIPLCEQGIFELKRMKEDMIYPDINTLFSSPLNRCLKTAEILFPKIKPIIIDDLIEYNFGEFEGLTADELKDKDTFKEWLSGGPDSAPPFGESNAQFGTRIANAFEKIIEGLMKTGVTESAIITHGGVIMGIMSMFAIPELPMPEWLVPNGCGFTVRITPSLWAQIKKMEFAFEIPFVEKLEAESFNSSLNEHDEYE